MWILNLKSEKSPKIFSRSDNLKRHISRVHEVGSNVNYYECEYCSKSYVYKRNLRSHIQKCMNKVYAQDRVSIFTCLHCGTVFGNQQIINKHYKEVHDICFVFKTYIFDSYGSFCDWKLELQRNKICQFYQYSYETTSTSIARRFKCHRSGIQQSKKNDAEYKKFPRISKKLNGFCPAELYVVMEKTKRTCQVRMQKTHVGHSITSENELAFLNLDCKEKECIQNKLLLGVEQNTIHNQYQSKELLEVPKRQDVINNDDQVANIASVPNNSDAENILNLIFEHQESIIFYKAENQESEEILNKYPKLVKDDFALIYMDKFQKNLLKQFGSHVVAYDSTPDTNTEGFTLHTILVIDEGWEGVGVAFMLSNRNDIVILEVFLDSIKEKVGVMSPHTLTTDIQPTFYNAFCAIMGKPECWFWCMWCIYDEWRKNQTKITGQKKRRNALKEAYKLCQITDEERFKKTLGDFLSFDDPDMKNFIEFFKKYYGSHPEQWAYCYQIRKEMNTNMCLESFHNSIKRHLLENRLNTKSVSNCLSILKTYITKQKRRRVQIHRSRRSRKATILRQRHTAATKFREQCTIEQFCLNDNLVGDNICWLVSSFSNKARQKEKRNLSTVSETSNYNKEYDIRNNTDKENIGITEELDDTDDLAEPVSMYIVQRHTNFSTRTPSRLRCEMCEISFDEFSCTCLDHLVCCNMCKHIHAVGILLKENIYTHDGFTKPIDLAHSHDHTYVKIGPSEDFSPESTVSSHNSDIHGCLRPSEAEEPLTIEETGVKEMDEFLKESSDKYTGNMEKRSTSDSEAGGNRSANKQVGKPT